MKLSVFMVVTADKLDRRFKKNWEKHSGKG